ncbi:molybdopterin-synthase adenylyltransferase MoeB [Candidatus Methylospira mobilis]|uniref:Molybdopterin-synthase adenylyltransferase MoeB n=1 Tax=Candidatus Methylospira mobilis TaxID=1808979 RepID=A0A5Q0BJP7_9GAMM|nr:molybdopterin-synthase adenylyltransferase MoeB [Candidatus Methylospira mobilis]QFY44033.1 molybdopterin-synthase adenylyltransferase MoeB [Candidatus Methylospira mobilis]WNV05037.1 molybdopterin-synthase adenylyltransferase MoeB [Candidatus Methylospira mobilis]
MEDNQLLRYSRQIMLPQIDIAGQQKLLDSRVLIIGLGGLGSPAALYLCAAGVGQLALNDFDNVDLSNLQRQVLHNSAAIGLPKVESAQKQLHELNPETQIIALNRRFEPDELLEQVELADIVLDCSDNFTTRFAVNAACVQTSTALVSGAVIRFEGQLAVFTPGLNDSPCYNCLYSKNGEQEESCARNGIVAPLPGIVGSMQALEAIKWLLNIGRSPVGKLQIFDALNSEWHRLTLRRDPACPSCGP